MKVATIGGGTFGEMHIRALTQRALRGDIDFVGLVDTNPEVCKTRRDIYGIETYNDINALLKTTKPQAVTVATPDHLHQEVVVECLGKGIHVLVEKPMDTTVKGCQEMVAAANASECLLQVDFMKRNDLYHLHLKQTVDTDGLGRIAYGYAWMEDKIEVPRDWLPAWASHSSPAWFVGVHYFDLIRWLVGHNAIAVSATGVKDKLLSIGIDTYDSIQSKIVFPNGVSFVVDTAWHLPDGNEAIVNQGIKVVGSDGWLTVDSQDRGTRGCVRQGPSSEARMNTPNLGFFKEVENPAGLNHYSGYAVDSIEGFVDNALGLVQGSHQLSDLDGNYPSGIDGLEVTKIAVGVHESVESEGALIMLDEL